MKKSILYHTVLLILLTLVWTTRVYSQQPPPDSLFRQAQQWASQKSYPKAIEILNSLTKQHPENRDYSLYLARLFFWSGSYNDAQTTLLPFITKEPILQEAFDLLIQVDFQRQDYLSVIRGCVRGTELFPNNLHFYHLQQALALEKLDRDEEAKEVLAKIPSELKHRKDIEYLKTQILKKQKNMLSVGYLNTSFGSSGFSPWHLAYVEYLRTTKRSAYLGRINYAALPENQALQVEMEAYPKINQRSYLYLNTGFSRGKSIFPVARFGGEFYHEFKQYSVSIGTRYLHFNPARVLMLTGHFSVNFKEWKIAYRPFLVNQQSDWFQSHILSFRKSFETKESFIQLELQSGGMPYYFFINNEFSRINAYRIGVNSKFRLKNNLFVQPNLMYEREQFTPNQYRNRYNLQLILSQRF